MLNKKNLLSLLICICYDSLLFLLGNKLLGSNNILKIISISSIFILLLFLLLNHILCINLKNKNALKICTLKNIGSLYIISIFIILSINVLFIGSIQKNIIEIIIIKLSMILIILLFQLTILISLFQQPKIEIHNSSSKTLNSIIAEAIKISDLIIDKPIKINIFLSDNIGIEYNKNFYILHLGLYAIRLLNHEELLSMILHEMGHIKNNDPVLKYKMNSIISKLQALKTLWPTKYFFKYISNAIIINTKIYFDESSLEKEKKADNFVYQSGFSKDFINAIAKINIFRIYKSKLPRNYSYDIYKSTPTNIQELYYNIFINEYSINKDSWLELLEKEISSNNDTHPTFKERLINFNENFDINYQNIDKELLNEYITISYNFDTISVHEWEKDRDEYYSILNNLTSDPKELAEKHFLLQEYEISLKLYNDLLKKEPKNTLALYRIGILLLNNNDNLGLQYLRTAIDYNRELSQIINHIIIDYCKQNGLEY